MDVGDSLGVYDAKLLVESMMRECLEQEVGYVWSCPEERIFCVSVSQCWRQHLFSYSTHQPAFVLIFQINLTTMTSYSHISLKAIEVKCWS
mmetsp:Transcript_51932/g.108479  ORF Transcript_51932/g.108479 Transcript_51932/m.108479 type:complete len:91 (+) Transcript_51932:783-1055(+)